MTSRSYFGKMNSTLGSLFLSDNCVLLSITSVELIFRMKTYFSRSDSTGYIVDFHELVSNTEVGKKTK